MNAAGCRGDESLPPEVTSGVGQAVSWTGIVSAMAEVEAAGAGTETGGSSDSGNATGSGSGWRRPHGPLQRYYGPSAAEAAETDLDPADINGPHFDPEVFLTKVTFDPTATLASLGGPLHPLRGVRVGLLTDTHRRSCRELFAYSSRDVTSVFRAPLGSQKGSVISPVETFGEDPVAH